MAASLRSAATRILRPAAGRLRRLVHTEQLSRSTPRLEEGYLAAQIQQKKEELYDLIAQAQANSTASRPDKYVLNTLCTQVKPRPHDPQWRQITRAKKVTKWTATAFVWITGGIILGGLAARHSVIEHERYLVSAEIALQDKLQKQVE